MRGLSPVCTPVFLDLVRIYVSVIRPVVEYACPVWHTNLPKYLSDNVETVKRRALNTIFPSSDYEESLQMANLQSLAERRNEMCKIYFNKMKACDHKLHDLRTVYFEDCRRMIYSNDKDK